MKKIVKKTLKITGITLVVLIALVFLIPIIFRKQIVSLVKSEVNKSITAKVDFEDVDLSLFRHFPRISIALENVSIVGTEEFSKDTLVSAKTIDASVNLFSVIKGKDVKVYGVYLESPRIHAMVNKEGKANWDVAKESDDISVPADNTPSEFKMNLQNYKITDGYILYQDESSNMTAEISGLDHEGSGDFTEDLFTLATKTKAEAISFNYESVPYLINAKTDIASDIQIDNKTNTYTFKTQDIQVNNLKLNADGFFQLVNDSTYKMDIKFKTPSNEFKDILSMIPAIYKQDFDKIKTSGQASFDGFVNGTYSTDQLPAYSVNLTVNDGLFQYPDLPEPVKNIQLAMHLSNVDGKMDNTVVNVSKGHIEMGNEPFDFKFLFKNPETKQYIDATAKGKLDLANVSKFIKLEQGTKLGGLVLADVFAKGNMKSIETQNGDFIAGGFLDIKNLFYASTALPQPIRNGNMKVQVENGGGVADHTSINVTTGHVEIGKDPIDFTLQLRKPMSSVEFAGTAKGKMSLENISQFAPLEEGTSLKGILNADLGFNGNKSAIDKEEYDKILISGTAALKDVKYVSKDYPAGITVFNTELGFNQKSVSLKTLSGNYLNTNILANGTFTNLVSYTMGDQPLGGTMNLTADKINLNDWMGTDTAVTTTNSTGTTPGASPAPFVVPSDINFTVNAKADKVKYDKVDYNNINGTLVLNDETITLQNVRTDALDGTVTFNGSYSTRVNKTDPAINVSYDVKDVDVQKAFLAYNTIQRLMPIGQFLAGKLSSQLSMTGNLDGNMMPDFSSLSGKGNLLLIEGVLKKFAPLEKIASTLQIDELKSVSIKDIKNYIEFANGKVLVKPFNLKVKDIEMQIGGMHGFDQSLDYVVQMKVPRKYLGTEGNNIVNNLAQQAANKGLPVKMGDVVNLNIKLGGSLTNPLVKTDLKEAGTDALKDMQQQAVDFAKAKVDTVKQSVKDTLSVVKKQVVAGVKDEIKNRLFGNKDSVGTGSFDSTKKKTEQTLKNTFKSLLNRNKKPADSAQKQ